MIELSNRFKFFYSASVMGYGDGRSWHHSYNFPEFPRVTKTLTLEPKIGFPFVVVRLGKTVWNRVGLHNVGYHYWLHKEWQRKNRRQDIVVSLAGTDDEIDEILLELDLFTDELLGIELNFSCPNTKNYKNKRVPYTNLMRLNKCPLYLKLNYKQDPYKYDLSNVTGIRLNSVPWVIGGLSGKAARKENWAFIERFNKEGLNVAGCSFTNMYDLICLEELGCKEIGIGSTILTNPKLVERLGE